MNAMERQSLDEVVNSDDAYMELMRAFGGGADAMEKQRRGNGKFIIRQPLDC